jgi:hypothetical protein
VARGKGAADPGGRDGHGLDPRLRPRARRPRANGSGGGGRGFAHASRVPARASRRECDRSGRFSLGGAGSPRVDP